MQQNIQIQYVRVHISHHNSHYKIPGFAPVYRKFSQMADDVLGSCMRSVRRLIGDQIFVS